MQLKAAILQLIMYNIAIGFVDFDDPVGKKETSK